MSATFGHYVFWCLRPFHNSFALFATWHHLRLIGGGKPRVYGGVGKRHPYSCYYGLTEGRP
jgi:hypothetical protein